MSARHRQASKRWAIHKKASKVSLDRMQEHWRAIDTDTGEICPHRHHSRKSAMSCGRASFLHYRAEKIRDDTRYVKNRTQSATTPEPSYKPISKMSEIGQEYI